MSHVFIAQFLYSSIVVKTAVKLLAALAIIFITARIETSLSAKNQSNLFHPFYLTPLRRHPFCSKKAYSVYHSWLALGPRAMSQNPDLTARTPHL